MGFRSHARRTHAIAALLAVAAATANARSARGDAPADGAAAKPEPTPVPEDWFTVGSAPKPRAASTDSRLARPWALPPIEVPHPMLFTASTARILPAAVVYGGAAVDTGGETSSSAMVGLGDIGDFGVAYTSTVRARASTSEDAEPIFPYFTATLRLGIPENLVLPHQPGLLLGFRKSFERDTDGFKTRIAELFVVASKSLGTSTVVHAGVSLWDASLEDAITGMTDFLHERTSDQLRGIFGLEVAANPESSLVIEGSWVPEFGYQDRSIELTPKLSFGVRYQVVPWLVFESGVGIPDIGDVELLGAQIFGRLRLINRGVARAYQRWK